MSDGGEANAPAGTKRPREEDSPELGDPTYAAKKQVKLAIPKFFPNPHCYMEAPRHPWEGEFERCSREIRSKPNWIEKVHNEEILAKWKQELADKEYPWMWKRLLAELQFLASLADGQVEPSAVDGVYVKDDIIPKALHDKFVSQVAERLESQPKEYHPYSDETVVDLVHPALYCYVDGKSRVNEDPHHSQLRDEQYWKDFLRSGSPDPNPTLKKSLRTIARARDIQNGILTTTAHSEEEEEEAEADQGYLRFEPSLLVSSKRDIWADEEEAFDAREEKRVLSNHLASHFRWLPADVSVDMTGKVQFDSYINGLHPFENKELYGTIASIMEYFLPLWGNVLRDLSLPHHSLPHCVDRLDLSKRSWDDKAYGIFDERLCEEYDELKEKQGGEPELLAEFSPPEVPPAIDFSRASLRVIVKIASIELTPEKPTYKGTWHIEGVPEECILSTGIYYFDEENITDNFLQFRLAHGDPDNCSVQCPMGLGYGCVMNRNAGQVQTKQGRLIAFPNIMQHCVSSVSLQDQTKPGHRKILVFFLVDPNKNNFVVSTGLVPPPCKAWYENISAVKEDDPSLQTLEEARENRENLMFTRKFYVVSQNETFFERECTFCEH